MRAISVGMALNDRHTGQGVCSLIGGLSVSCTQGLGACIVTSIRGDNQVSTAKSRTRAHVYAC